MGTVSFQLGSGILTPSKKGDEKKDCSAINEVVTREYTPSTFTSTFTEWVSRSMPLGHSRRSGNLP